VSGRDLTLEPERQLRRFEVINGAGGRRHWTLDDKARIIAETLEPGAVVSEVARRYGLRPQQVFTWRRNARERAPVSDEAALAFVPAVVGPTVSEDIEVSSTSRATRRPVEPAAAVVRIGRADARTVAAVIRALKATS